MRWIVLLAAVVLSTSTQGCFIFRGDESPMREDQAIDPVTGWRVSKDTMWKTTRNGNVYYFYNRENMERFERDPQLYVDADGRVKNAKHGDAAPDSKKK
jgi:YHS domain-containing protein